MLATQIDENFSHSIISTNILNPLLGDNQASRDKSLELSGIMKVLIAFLLSYTLEPNKLDNVKELL